MQVIAVPKIFVKNNKDKILKDDTVAIISIIDTGEHPIFEKDTFRHLTLFFDDIHPTTTCTLQLCSKLKAMDVKDAQKILTFINGITVFKEKHNINKIIVHCTAGVCRSGGVADFLRVFLNLDNEIFWKNNPHILPNEWVRDLLWMTWRMQNEIN